MEQAQPLHQPSVARDLTAGLVVALVAMPLCLGVALASNAPLSSGVLAGIVGGILVGSLSGTRMGVSGPAAGLTAVVSAQIAVLGSFQGFLVALVVAGLIQIALGLVHAGSLAAFVPSSVVKGLLTAIGVLLIARQIPQVLGYDPDPNGFLAFLQPEHSKTFLEFLKDPWDGQPGAAMIGLVSVAILVLWRKSKRLRESIVPSSLIVVLVGIGLSLLFERVGGIWPLETSRRVQLPVVASLAGYLPILQFPDFAQWTNPAVYAAALTIAIVASLESLLNLEAVDRIAPQPRSSPRSRELLAQGVGNLVSGLVGGIPVTLVIARSSVNIQAGGRSKLATIFQGALLLMSVVLIPTWLNLIPLSCLAAILLMTGINLARPSLIKRMWDEGHSQFIPFAATVVAIVLTDLLVGILIGLAVSLGIILRSNARRPVRRIVEKHLGGEVVHIELANQVSFLNRAALARALDEVPPGGHVLLDAQETDYIDPDLVSLIRDFKEQTGPARGVEVSLLGFRDTYDLQDRTQYVDHSTRELQAALTPEQVLQILKDGHERFRTGQRLTRDLGRQVRATASGQHPLAVVLSCIDSRTPAELIFDLGMGDIFGARVAGNVTSQQILGSVEYGCAVAGAKLILVMGHTRCGAVTGAVQLFGSIEPVAKATGCQHLEPIVHEIQKSIDPLPNQSYTDLSEPERESFVNAVARRNVQHTVEVMLEQSQTLQSLARDGRIAVVGAMYDVATGNIEFL